MRSPPPPVSVENAWPAGVRNARRSRRRVIGYARGRITIVDRAGLESAVCECYGVIRGEYRRLLGGPGPPRGRKGGKESPDR
jgi:hypothetical protein